MIESREESDPYLKLAWSHVDELPPPTPGSKNAYCFLDSHGNCALKTAPWIDPETGEEINTKPHWADVFELNNDIDNANYFENLPDYKLQKGFNPDSLYARLLKNPVTGETRFKMVPWLKPGRHPDSNIFANPFSKAGLIELSEYMPGLEVSMGRKIIYDHNPYEEFDDPTDPKNLRFFTWDDMSHRVLSHVFLPAHLKWDKMMHKDIPDKAIIGINLGGTILMQERDNGLAPGGEIMFKFQDFRKESYDFGQEFKNHHVASCVFPLAKREKDTEAAFGLDSSQLEIDFIADVAIAMTCA